MGDLQGKKLEGSREALKLVIAADKTVEPSSSFTSRLETWWNQTILQSVLSRFKDDEEILNVLVVTHGGVIATLIRNLLGSQKIKTADGVVVWRCINASVTVIEVDRSSRKGVLICYGDVAHLGQMDLKANADQEIVT